jgi:hypothetical protein
MTRRLFRAYKHLVNRTRRRRGWRECTTQELVQEMHPKARTTRRLGRLPGAREEE